MKFRDFANLAIRPLFKSELRKVQQGSDLWRDVLRFSGGTDARVVFDVGANIGQSAEDFLKLFPRAEIYCFEPGPRAYRQLASFAEGKSRVRPFNCALGAIRGQFEFQENDLSVTNSFLNLGPDLGQYLDEKQMAKITPVMVQVETMDSFCSDKQVERIDMAKLDVQGFELNVLQGAVGLLRAQSIRALVLEIMFVPFYQDQATFCQMQEFLARYGYHIAGFYNYAPSEKGRLMWCDALFIPEA